MHISAKMYDEKLRELIQHGKAQVVAEPAMMLKPNQTSRFHQGDQFPIPIPVDDGEMDVEWRKVGTEVTATAIPEGDSQIRLELFLSESEIDSANTVEMNGIRVPAVSRRRMQSTVMTSLDDARICSLETGEDQWTVFRYELTESGSPNLLEASGANAKGTRSKHGPPERSTAE